MPSLRVLIADDEPIARRRLAGLLRQLGGTTLIGETGNGPQTVEAVHRLRPDILLLDVQMPGGDGFWVLDQLVGAPPHVVFVTAYDRYALRAFDAAAVDYLTKPVEIDRLEQALLRARRLDGASDAADQIAELRATLAALRRDAATEQPPSRDLWVKERGRYQRLSLDLISHISAERDYARVHMDGKSYLMPETLATLSERLADAGFIRVHRSYLVRSDKIRSVARRKTGALTVLLEGEISIPVGRRHGRPLLNHLSGRPGL